MNTRKMNDFGLGALMNLIQGVYMGECYAFNRLGLLSNGGR